MCSTGDVLLQGVPDEDLDLENQSEEGMTPTRRTYALYANRPACSHCLASCRHRLTASARSNGTDLKRCVGLTCSQVFKNCDVRMTVACHCRLIDASL